MAGKNRNFAGLTAGLADLTGTKPAQAPATPPLATPTQDVTPTAETKGRGRPVSDTTPLQLRLPRTTLAALVKEAAEASIDEGRNVTPQQIIGRILEARYHG